MLDARLSREGVPLLSLGGGRAYIYDSGLGAWVCVADESLAASQFVPMLRLSDQGERQAEGAGPRGKRELGRRESLRGAAFCCTQALAAGGQAAPRRWRTRRFLACGRAAAT